MRALHTMLHTRARAMREKLEETTRTGQRHSRTRYQPHGASAREGCPQPFAVSQPTTDSCTLRVGHTRETRPQRKPHTCTDTDVTSTRPAAPARSKGRPSHNRHGPPQARTPSSPHWTRSKWYTGLTAPPSTLPHMHTRRHREKCTHEHEAHRATRRPAALRVSWRAGPRTRDGTRDSTRVQGEPE